MNDTCVVFRRPAVGLTVDFEHDQLYWIVQEFNSASLYRADVEGAVRSVTDLQTTNDNKGPLQFVSGRLLWLQNETVAVVSDLNGRNVSLLQSPETRRISYFMIVDKSYQSSFGELSNPMYYQYWQRVRNS